jgi:hypothetical protein
MLKSTDKMNELTGDFYWRILPAFFELLNYVNVLKSQDHNAKILFRTFGSDKYFFVNYLKELIN